jgi:hypothetical protein
LHKARTRELNLHKARTRFAQSKNSISTKDFYRGLSNAHCLLQRPFPVPPVNPIIDGEAQELFRRSTRPIHNRRQITANHGPRLGSNRRALGEPCCPQTKTEKGQNKQGRRKPQTQTTNIHSQSVGLEGTDQCGFQSDFPVSAAVTRE